MRICSIRYRANHLRGQSPIFAIAVLTSRTACWGPRWAHNRPYVAKVWFESTSQLYHGEFNYDRRWKLLFRNCIVFFCHTPWCNTEMQKSNKIQKRLVDASISVLCWRSSTVERHHCSVSTNVKIAVQICSLAFKAHLFLIKATFNERRKHLLTRCFLP